MTRRTGRVKSAKVHFLLPRFIPGGGLLGGLLGLVLVILGLFGGKSRPYHAHVKIFRETIGRMVEILRREAPAAAAPPAGRPPV